MRWSDSDYHAYLRRQEEKQRPRRDGSMSEAALLEHIRTLARQSGWLVYHTHDSRGSEAGFPDLCMTNGRRLVFWELKTQRGSVTIPQAQWLERLARAQLVETRIVRPSDVEDIARWLS